MKGIVLAGGIGTRLYPSTLAISKQLLPVYDKPMIYYPLSVLMLAGIRDILIITTPEDANSFKKLLKDGSQFGVSFSYIVQPKAEGIAQALILGEDFIEDDEVALILGDNIFYGGGFTGMLNKATKSAQEGIATIFGYKVRDAQRFGVVEFDKAHKVLSIEEKPSNPKSDYAVTGLYFYPKGVSKIAKTLKPSHRGELEITDINRIYMEQNKLNAIKCPRGFTWLDTGLHRTLLQAGQYIQAVEENQDIKIACLEEIAIRNNFISKEEVLAQFSHIADNEYYAYITNLD